MERGPRSTVGHYRWWTASIGLVALYGVLAVVVRRFPDNRLDRRLLEWISGWEVAGLDRGAELVSWITDTEPRVVMATIGLIGVAATGRIRFAAAVLLTTVITGTATNALDDAAGVFTGRIRPNGAPFKAYPSGHTLGTITQFGFTIYLAMRLGLPRRLLGVVAVVFAVPMVLVGPARLVRGVHWPTDVLGSYLLGAGSLVITVLVFEIIERWLAGSGRFGRFGRLGRDDAGGPRDAEAPGSER